MATTMKDVARRAGVDVSTVSLAMNNDPRIRTETRARILTAATELGYRKNLLARGLRSGKSFTIGAVVGSATPFWAEALAGAQSVLSEHDYHLILDYAPDAGRREETQIEALTAKRVDGLLIAPPDSEALDGDEETLRRYLTLKEQEVPFVFLDRFIPGVDADAVAVDDFAAARQATEYLLAHGHRRIAYVFPPHRMNTAQRDRREGYRKTMETHGAIPILWGTTTPGIDRREEAWAETRLRLQNGSGQSGQDRGGVTAVLAATDSMAVGVLRALYEAKVSVPEEMALIGCGGAAFAEYLQPPLSAIALPVRELGSQAAQLLLRRIEGDTAPPRRVLLPTRLVIRGSC